MTLKELAEQLNRPMGEVVKSLTRNGFKGIYKNNHQVPTEAVEIVSNDFTGNLNALPSANPDTIQEVKQEPITAPSGNAGETENQLGQVSQALTETETHLAKVRNQQLINDFTAVGIREALTANMARKAGYTQTAEALAVMDANAQQAMISEIMTAISNKDFFAGKTPQESYYKASQHTENNTLINEWSAVLNNIK